MKVDEWPLAPKGITKKKSTSKGGGLWDKSFLLNFSTLFEPLHSAYIMLCIIDVA